MKITEKNVKKQQKTDYFENPTEPSLLLGEPAFSSTLTWRNEPNFNTSNIIATSYSTVGYNVSFQNSTKKTNPVKANLKPIPNTIKTSLFSGEPAISSTLICKNKPNFPDQRNTANSCCESAYNDFYPEIPKKNKPKTNPNKPNFFTTPNPIFVSS